MTTPETSGVDSNPLLAPLNTEQHEVIRLLEATFRQQRTWPPWQFVEEVMDRSGIDALAATKSMPQLGRKHGIYGLTYGLIWTHGMAGGATFQPGDLIGLTMAGLHRADASDLVRLFLRVLNLACRKLATFSPDPQKVVTTELTSSDVLSELTGPDGESVPLASPEIYELLQHEPAMWTGGRGINPDGEWRWELSRSIRPYCQARTMNEYVEAVARAAEESAVQIAQLVPLLVQPPYPTDDEGLGTGVGIPTASSVVGHEAFFAPRIPLLGSGIDADLWEYVRPLVEAGRWEQVAREAAAFVETRTRDWTGSRREILDLIHEVLAPQGEAHDKESAADRSEKEGWYLLGRGFFLAIRNHVMHNSVGTEEELQYGLGALGTASLLMRRIRATLDAQDIAWPPIDAEAADESPAVIAAPDDSTDKP